MFSSRWSSPGGHLGIGVDLGVVRGVGTGEDSRLNVVGDITPLNGLIVG